jgi:three-Cys-motif partner protein
MVRRKTKTGQQYSEATPYKLKGFRYLMAFHAGVCQIILEKYNQSYIYIDLNCGAGYQPEYGEFGDEIYGSPIIALQELNKKGIEPICHFCDNNQEALNNLKKLIEEDLLLKCQPFYWHGDNKESLVKIAQQINNKQFCGLVYSDPNGKQDFPLKEIKETFQLPQMKKVDLLLNVATTYVKRWEKNPKAKAAWDVYSLDELIMDHGKIRIFIRQPENPSLKWTFIYATNWNKQKNLPKISLYDINNKIGKQIIEHLFSPASTPLPQINEDGSAMIQGDLLKGLDSSFNKIQE